MAAVDEAQLGAVMAATRRAAIARGADSDEVADISQEAIARLLAAADRLESDAWLPYAVVVAGNLTVASHRQAATARRHQHRLLEGTAPDDPAFALAAREQAEAVRTALAELPAADRDLLVRHVEGASTSELADATESTPGGVAARLARIRARLRLDYVLAYRRITLPEETCRRVLLAISAGDQRRQQALGASGHLTHCPTCPGLIEPLVTRRSGLAGIFLAPLALLGKPGGQIHGVIASAPAQTAAVVGTAAAVAAGGIAASQGGGGSERGPVAATLPPRPSVSSVAPSPPAATVRSASGARLLPLQAAVNLRAFAGQTVVASAAPVQSVVSHPGFWVGTSAANRLYVHITRTPLFRGRITAGHTVSFRATVVVNEPGFGARDGVSGAEGLGLLNSQGVHLEVDATVLTQN